MEIYLIDIETLEESGKLFKLLVPIEARCPTEAAVKARHLHKSTKRNNVTVRRD